MTQTIQPPAIDENTTKAWMRVAFVGAIMMVAWSILLQALAGFIPPVAVLGLIFAIFAVFLRGYRPRLGLVVAIVAALAVLGNLPIILDDLTHPESAPAFILNLMSLTAIALMVIGGFAAFRGFPTNRIGQVAKVAPAVFVVGAVFSLLMAANTHSVPVQLGDVELVAAGVAWGPGEITVSSGNGVWIDNRDGIRHTFTIEDEGVDLEIVGLKSSRIDLDLEPGSYQFVCAVPGHESMVGTLTVSS